jgi:predicted outer membrane protein
MSASLRLRLGIAAAGLSCLFAGYGLAQQLTERERESAAQQRTDSSQPAGQTDRATTERREYTARFRGAPTTAGNPSVEVERFLANCLLAKNQSEVELGKLAQSHAQNPQVKEFAQTMVQDHQQLVQKLQALAGGSPTSTRTETSATFGASGQIDADTTRVPGSPGANQLDTDRSDAIESVERDVNETLAADRSPGQNAALQQLADIERQIHDRHMQAVREELKQKQGAEFDKCYVGGQIAGHMHMLASLEVISQQGPEQLQQIAQQAQPKVQKHLDQAKQLMKQLEGETAATAERPSRTPR